LQRKPVLREDIYFVLTSFAHVVVAVIFGMLLNLSRFPGPLLIGFALSSKAFALAIGENERVFTKARWAAYPLAAVSIILLVFLPPVDMVIGVAVMLLYLTYPRIIKAREKGPLDVLFHGTRYALLFWLGYGGSLTLLSATAVTTVFLFGVTGELLVGLRNPVEWRTSAARLGADTTVKVVSVLTFLLILLGSLIFSQVVDFPLIVGSVTIPIPFLVGLPVAIFLTRPVSRKGSWSAPVMVRKREIIAILLVASVILATPLVTRVDLSQTAPSENYSVVVGMQTIVTGPKSWDGQWIVFNYTNQSNYYYILLHTNGTLELSRYVDGVRQTNIQDISTGLSPFQWHEYQIEVVNGAASISIDGKQVMTANIQDPGGEALVSQSIPHQTFWVIRVTEFEVSGA
jgi:hypothetical protein